MIWLAKYPNIGVDGQLIFSTGMKVLDGQDKTVDFDFKNETLWKSAADTYEKNVEQLFDQLDGTATGSAVLRAVGRLRPKTIVVEPSPSGSPRIQDPRVSRHSKRERLLQIPTQ